MYARISALLVAFALVMASAATAQERFGTLRGTVTDQQGQAVPGVTVTITNAVSGEPRSYVTDTSGEYVANDLNPGRYNVVFELTGFSKVDRTDILVLVGRTFDVNAQLRVGSVTETVQVTGQVPLVDIRSTVVSHNVSSEEIDRLPKTRSFQSIALSAPSVNQGEIEGGFQVNGASGAENAFAVDGVVTNSLINGKSRQDTVFEYLEEVQVQTTGINAEFGGALGGVVSAVTKSGGNVFRGEGHYYFLGSPLSAGPPKRLNLDPADDKTVRYLQDENSPDYQNELGGSIGGPIVRDRLFFFGSYSPRLRRETRNYMFSNGTEPGQLKRKQTYTQAFGKVSYAQGRMLASGTLLFTPVRSTGTLPSYQGAGNNFIASSLASNDINRTRGFDQDQINATGNVDLAVGGSALLQVRGGYFYDNYKDTGVPNSVSHTYQATTTGVPGIPASLQGPINTQDVPRILLNNFDTTKRSFVNVDFNQPFNAGGSHTLKAGVGFQHTVNDVNKSYNGGAYVYLWWGQPFVFQGNRGTGTYGYYEVNNFGTQGKAGGDITSLYVQDQWSVASRLTLNLGIRTEREIIPSFRPDILANAMEFNFADKLAPRLGASYDVRGDGQWKIFGSYGRYFDWTKYELSRGSYGGDVWQIWYRSLDTLDIASLSPKNMPGRDLWVVPGGFRNRRVPNFDSTDPDVKPMSQDSFSLGSEYQLGGNSSFGVHYVHNDLIRTIEDIGALDAHGDEAYIIGNPGEGLSRIQAPSGATPIGQPLPKPKRQYDALELTYSRRFASNWFGSASYVLSRLYGNYSGIGSSDEITPASSGFSSSTAQQATGSTARPGGNVNRDWDIDEQLWDSKGHLDPRGRLATDRPHVVKLYGGYVMPFGTTLAANFYGGSGTPLTTYVTTTNGTRVFVNGRGDLGRTSALVRTDLLVAHEVNLGGSKRLRAEFNVLNVFNRKVARYQWVWLNRTSPSVGTRPASAIDLSRTDLTKGYDYNALLAATPDGRANNVKDPRFGMDDIFDTGTQSYVTIKYIF
ncbi:MAG: TonB-dependent receptor [Acidobacteria bacterium]|nr:TonB-dependent receptor [Acidobacteriota bacterium]